MPFLSTAWPPQAEQRSFGQRGAHPLTFAWPPGGTMQWCLAPAEAPVSSPKRSRASPSGYEAHEANGGLDQAAAGAVQARARGAMTGPQTPTLPAAAHDGIAALRQKWIALHGMEEGLNIFI